MSDLSGHQPSASGSASPELPSGSIAERSTVTGGATAKPEKKRRRPALACEQCRKRKIRCDRNSPCNHCVKSRIPDCSYAPTHIPASWKKAATGKQPAVENPIPSTNTQGAQQLILPAPTSTFQPSTAANPSTDGFVESEFIRSSRERYVVPADSTASKPSSVAESSSTTAGKNVDWLVARVHHLEEKLSKVVTISDESPVYASPSTQCSAPITGTVAKTRYFGRSHWMNGANLLPLEMKLMHKVELEKGHLAQQLTRCKVLGRTIKEARLKPLSTNGLGRSIPSRERADELVAAYLRTFEGVLRILHIPSFQAEYERYWQTPSGASDFFTIQLQLVMALGAVFLDDVFSLRSQATQWVYEAQLWLMMPPEKSRMTIAGIQIMCLLTLARSVCGVGSDLVWITTGGLVRKAMYMGLHRDPRHLADMTTYRAEMRRRLWATILELNLQSSFDAGGPPLISVMDYDVHPPANLDDEQLGDELDRERKPVNPDAVTQMSTSIALLKSLPLRLALLRHANDFRAEPSYDETLRYNSELTKACRSHSQSMTLFIKNQSGVSSPKVTTFHASMSELLIYRCFHTLHQPVITQSLEDPRFYFSRKMYLDGALKITHICNLSGANRASGPGGSSSPQDMTQSDLDRLITSGAGTFRNIPMQSLPCIAVEILHNASSSMGAGMGLGYLPAVHDYDLRATIEAGKEWTIRRIRSGETNIKGHCFVHAVLRHIDAVAAGKLEEEVEKYMLDGAVGFVQDCYEELRKYAEREGLLPVGARANAGAAGGGHADQSIGDAGVGGHVGVMAAGEPSIDVPVMGMGSQMGLGEDDMMVDFMGDWAWDEMNGLLWGSPRPFDDVHPPIFA